MSYFGVAYSTTLQHYTGTCYIGIVCVCVCVCVCAQSCPTLCSCMDYSLPGSSVHGILQAEILESKNTEDPTPEDLPNPGIKPETLASPAFTGGFFTTVLLGRASLLAQTVKNLPAMQETKSVCKYA